MTGSFLFVKPSNPEGIPGHAYDDETKPCYAYDLASWEWLLERAIRRYLLPQALTKSHARDILAGHENKYSLHRWGAYTDDNIGSVTPSVYDNVGGHGAGDKYTDAKLSNGDRKASLPSSWNPRAGSLGYLLTKIAYGVPDLESLIATLPFGDTEWLHPSWSPAALSEWNLSASTEEHTQGSSTESGYATWTWVTDVTHTPYTIPGDLPFKCLSHMRTDDDLDTVQIEDNEGNTIDIETAVTPVHASRDENGSVVTFNGAQIRSASKGAAFRAGWALSEFSVKYTANLNYAQSTYNGNELTAYARNAPHTEETSNTIGSLVTIPNSERFIAVSYGQSEARFIPEVDWSNEPTWWHSNSFPKGLSSIISQRLRTQLEVLCTKCQPAIVPAIPALYDGFPETSDVSWGKDTALWRSYFPYLMTPARWEEQLALAATPLDLSARLAAMNYTVHKVPVVFAKGKSVRTTIASSQEDSIHQYWDLENITEVRYSTHEDTRTEVIVEGTTSQPIPTGSSVDSLLSGASGNNSRLYQTTFTDGTTIHTIITEVGTANTNLDAKYDFIVCLRSSDNTSISSTRLTKLYRSITSDGQTRVTETEEGPYGQLPTSYIPDQNDVMFPDWLLPWIESAELFASVESKFMIGDNSHYTTVRNYRRRYSDTYENSYAGTGEGTRIHKAKRKIISLGEMDTATGRFPAVDLTTILTGCDPEPSAAYDNNYYETVPTSQTFTEVSEYPSSSSYNEYSNNEANITETTQHNGYPGTDRYRTVSYYVVVKWKFDRTNPEPLNTNTELTGKYRTLADAKYALANKKQELNGILSAIETAQATLQPMQDSLELAVARRDNPNIEDIMLTEAQAVLTHAQQAYSTAVNEKSNALNSFTNAKATLDTTGVSASSAYSQAATRLSEAVIAEHDAKTSLTAAQEYYDNLHDNFRDLLQKAVNDAQTSINEVREKLVNLTQTATELRNEIAVLEAAVEVAKQAIVNAGGSV